LDEGREISTFTLEECKNRFLHHIKIINQKTGKSNTEVFWSFIDWNFWMTMWETRKVAEKLEMTEFAPYDKETCKERAFAARDFLLKEKCGVSFGIMQNLWVQGVAIGKCDFLLELTNAKDLNKNHRMLSKELGQFFTPKCVTDLIARMISSPEDDEKRNSVCDPAAGFGGMLISDWYKYDGMAKPAGSRIYFASELSTRTARACFLNMVIHNIPAVVDNINSLSQERISPRWFTPLLLMIMKLSQPTEWDENILLSNPPFTKEFGLHWLADMMMEDSKGNPEYNESMKKWREKYCN
tara:strand:- start:2481 stop:3371 length:891 start_codon:yes stop_codon:yes gene_type:complete